MSTATARWKQSRLSVTKNKKKELRQKEKEIGDHYKLNTKAVDDLISASKGNAEPVTEAELRKYTSGNRFYIPTMSKVIFTKFWFAGACCYFFVWGLGLYIPTVLDLVFITAVAMGFVTDMLTNNVLRYIEVVSTENNKWMMVKSKGMLGLFLNIIYSIVLMACVWLTYNGINTAINSILGQTDQVPLGVEPVFFGLFYMGYDMLFIGLKRVLARILDDAKMKVQGEV
ncbi:MAG: hypothetical protein IJ836_06230 [Spirochaetales bacterium]|nr:hypothetical protein [Spirochaetales bacterium]